MSTWAYCFNPPCLSFSVYKRTQWSPLHRADVRIKGMMARGHSEPLGTQTLSNCEMSGSAFQLVRKGPLLTWKGASQADRQGPPGERAAAFISTVPKCRQQSNWRTRWPKNKTLERAHQRTTKEILKELKCLELKIICKDCMPGTVFKELSIYSLITWYNSTFVYFHPGMCLDPSHAVSFLTSYTPSKSLMAAPGHLQNGLNLTVPIQTAFCAVH